MGQAKWKVAWLGRSHRRHARRRHRAPAEARSENGARFQGHHPTRIWPHSDALGARRAAPRGGNAARISRRWELHNELFHSETRILGATARQPGFPSFAISRRYIAGNSPTDDQLVSDLSARDYFRVPGEWLFYNPDTRLAIFNARPANFKWPLEAAMPVDVIPFRADERMHTALMQLLD